MKNKFITLAALALAPLLVMMSPAMAFAKAPQSTQTGGGHNHATAPHDRSPRVHDRSPEAHH